MDTSLTVEEPVLRGQLGAAGRWPKHFLADFLSLCSPVERENIVKSLCVATEDDRSGIASFLGRTSDLHTKAILLYNDVIDKQRTTTPITTPTNDRQVSVFKFLFYYAVSLSWLRSCLCLLLKQASSSKNYIKQLYTVLLTEASHIAADSPAFLILGNTMELSNMARTYIYLLLIILLLLNSKHDYFFFLFECVVHCYMCS